MGEHAKKEHDAKAEDPLRDTGHERRRAIPSVPPMAPGTSPLTLIPWGPHSQARTLVIASMAALAEAEWT